MFPEPATPANLNMSISTFDSLTFVNIHPATGPPEPPEVNW
jgi:hypothetical protein